MSDNEVSSHTLTNTDANTSPFQDDFFNRRKLAEKFTTHIQLINSSIIGRTIGIEAPWGEGKTWFAKNWQAYLEQQEYRVIYFDAFKHDYVEDPFLAIAAELSNIFEKNQNGTEKFLDKAKKVGRAVVPFLTKFSLNFIGRVALGSANLEQDIKELAEKANETVADATEAYLEKYLEKYEEEKKNIEEFKKSLEEFIRENSENKPVVFFIDELDRCKPSFAVRMLERIKHFFDVPNLVFVLFINRDQLEAAICGEYGEGTDAQTYIRKFIRRFDKLPNVLDFTEPDSKVADRNKVFCNQFIEKFPSDINVKEDAIQGFIKYFSRIASYMGFSLRDLEDGMLLFIMSNSDGVEIFLSWLIALKIKKPNIFDGLVKNEKTAHEQALKFLRGGGIYDFFRVLHLHQGDNFDLITPGDEIILKKYENTPAFKGHHRPRYLRILMERIDTYCE